VETSKRPSVQTLGKGEGEGSLKVSRTGKLTDAIFAGRDLRDVNSFLSLCQQTMAELS